MSFRLPHRLIGAAMMTSLLAGSLVAATDLTDAADVSGDVASPYDLDQQPVPPVTGAAMTDAVDAFSNEFTGRITGTPMELLAGQWLEEQAADLGYTTRFHEFPLTDGLPDTGPIRAVTAFKEGTDPVLKDEIMLFTAHYDIVPQAITAAYDNGTGTIMLLALAESLKDVDTRRSIMFAWYSGEEEGAFGSAAHVQQAKAEGLNIAIDLGFDMVGVAWPVAPEVQSAKNCLCMWHGADDEAMADVLRTVNFDYLGFPQGNPVRPAVSVVGVNARNSDERSWESAGSVTMRWAGIKTASGYTQYHLPEDNMATIYAEAGGREYFEQGMRNTLLSAYYTALAVDTIDDVGSRFLETPAEAAALAAEGYRIEALVSRTFDH